MISIAAIMVLAYTLSGMISQLGTAGYLSSLLTRFMAPAIFSAVAFLFTCIISFSTGTSAGTIAIMMPILLPMAVSFGTPIPLICLLYTSKGGFSKNEQIRLRQCCDELNRRGIKFMLSNSATPFIMEQYAGYNITVVQAKRAVNSVGSKRGGVDEVVVRNYE